MLLSAAPFRGTAAAQARGAVGLTATIALSAAALPYFASGDAALLSSADQQVGALTAAEVPPLLLRDVDREDALSINARIPFSREPNPVARPFKIRGGSGTYDRALHCLTEAIYYEAGSEPPEGQRAVAQVILNRVRHPAFSQSVCAAVYHGSMRKTGCQFSYTCDGSLRRRPTGSGWATAQAIAEQALAGSVFEPVGYATHYHASYVVPYWATSLAKNAIIGRHIFYRWPGWWGNPDAFTKRHSGKELEPRLLRNAALRRYGVRPEPPAWTAEDLILAADPRVELISIVHLLASGLSPGPKATPYEMLVREHFGSYENHVAVEIYRQLAAANDKFTAQSSLRTVMHYSQVPELESRETVEHELVSAAGGKRKLDGFISALRDFVSHSEFEKFIEERKPLYTRLEEQTRQPAFELVNWIEFHTGVPVQRVRFVLAPLLADSGAAGCKTVPKRAPFPWVIVGLRDSSEQPFDKLGELQDSIESLVESECLSSSRAEIAA